MRAGNVTGPRRGNGHVAVNFPADDLMKMDRSSRWRVAFSFVVSLFNKWIVRIHTAKQFSSARRYAIKELHADREIRAVNQRAIVLLDHTSHLFELRLPTRRADNQRHTCARACLHVL